MHIHFNVTLILIFKSFFLFLKQKNFLKYVFLPFCIFFYRFSQVAPFIYIYLKPFVPINALLAFSFYLSFTLSLFLFSSLFLSFYLTIFFSTFLALVFTFICFYFCVYYYFPCPCLSFLYSVVYVLLSLLPFLFLTLS
jgi:hypothetical protein